MAPHIGSRRRWLVPLGRFEFLHKPSSRTLRLHYHPISRLDPPTYQCHDCVTVILHSSARTRCVAPRVAIWFSLRAYFVAAVSSGLSTSQATCCHITAAQLICVQHVSRVSAAMMRSPFVLSSSGFRLPIHGLQGVDLSRVPQPNTPPGPAPIVPA